MKVIRVTLAAGALNLQPPSPQHAVEHLTLDRRTGSRLVWLSGNNKCALMQANQADSAPGPVLKLADGLSGLFQPDQVRKTKVLEGKRSQQ